jgi:hypothetical protein
MENLLRALLQPGDWKGSEKGAEEEIIARTCLMLLVVTSKHSSCWLGAGATSRLKQHAHGAPLLK